jgi:replicative DNA helicase
MTGQTMDAPPVNLEAEQALLGHMLRGAACPDFVGQQHFADAIHGLIHSAMERHRLRGLPVSLTSITAHFQRSGELDEVGGTSYLGQLYSGLRAYKPDLSISPTEHARLIHDAWVQRMTLVAVEITVGKGDAA